MFSKEGLNQLFNSFNKLKVLVVGDIMLDAYIFGKVERISPEAPVPIVAIQRRENRLGGAANVALNLKSLGAEPIICSVIGKDQKGEELIGEIEKESLSVQGIIKSRNRITTTKFRIIGNNAQMLRVDEEVTHDLTDDEANELTGLIKKIFIAQQIDAVIFQDYNKGNLSSKVIAEIVKLANEKGIVTTVDPKSKNFLEFRNVSLFKPNLKELKNGLNVRIDEVNKDNLLQVVKELNNTLQAKMIMTTLSERGVFISEFGNEETTEAFLAPAHKRSISDVSGAGDTVISVATLCLALKQTALQIAELSNLAGGIVCEEVGVVPVDKNRLFEEALVKLTK